MSHDFARSQRIRKEAPRAPKRKKSKGIPSWLWVLVGTLVGCLIMFLVYLSGVRPPLPAPVLAPQHPATSSETPAAEQPPAPPKRVSPVFEFYTKLPEGGQPVTDIAPAEQPTMPPPTTPTTDTAGQPVAATATAGATPAPATVTATAPTAAVAATTTVEPPVAPVPETKTAAVKVQPEEELDPMQQLLVQTEQERKLKAQEKAPKEKSSVVAAKTAASASTSGARYLQAGVFRNKAEAEKLRSKMSRLGVGASIRAASDANGASLQKVLAGPFHTSAEADNARLMLNGNGINTIPMK